MAERSAILEFGALLGLAPRHAEDALHSERAARAVLSRRSFFAASGALAASNAFSFAAVPAPWPERMTDALCNEALRDALRRFVPCLSGCLPIPKKAKQFNMAKKQKPSIVIAYWDTSDPGNEGWAWRAIWYDHEGEREHEESGGFDGRENLSRVRVERRARKAAGFPGTRIPVEIKD